jgi:hypothetical protein
MKVKMYKNIVLIITNYYYYILKNSLQVLNILNKSDLEYILSYIKREDENIEEYFKKIKYILINSINNLTKEKILYKIDFFLNTKIFPSVNKSIYINPVNIINKNKITLELLQIFFRTILYDSILEYYLNKTRDVNYYKKYDNLKLNTEEDFINIYKIINYLEEDINIFYKNIYLPFYVNIINKLDHDVDYIFPMIIENNILVSGVINDKEFKICDKECIKVIESNDYNNTEKALNTTADAVNTTVNTTANTVNTTANTVNTTADAVNTTANTVNTTADAVNTTANTVNTTADAVNTITNATAITDIENFIAGRAGNPEIIMNKLEEMYNEPYIKNLYTKTEIEQLESILNNEKLNSLIKQKKIKLSKNFQEMLKNITEKKDFKNIQDYVKKIFIVQDNKENINIDKIANIIDSNLGNNKNFLEYFIDKIIYNDNLNNNGEVISMIDNIFDKILTHDYNHNSLNLENEDIKFILMLETLNALKSNNLQMPSTSNITVNVYKDIDKAKINNNEIQIDY